MDLTLEFQMICLDYFWLRQELNELQSVSVCPFGDQVSLRSF